MVLFAFDHAVDLHAVRCGRNAPGKEKSLDFNSQRAVSQIAPPDAFSAGEAFQ
jgi:hypothetical protein